MGRSRGRGSSADFPLSAEPHAGLDLLTLRSLGHPPAPLCCFKKNKKTTTQQPLEKSLQSFLGDCLPSSLLLIALRYSKHEGSAGSWVTPDPVAGQSSCFAEVSAPGRTPGRTPEVSAPGRTPARTPGLSFLSTTTDNTLSISVWGLV